MSFDKCMKIGKGHHFFLSTQMFALVEFTSLLVLASGIYILSPFQVINRLDFFF